MSNIEKNSKYLLSGYKCCFSRFPESGGVRVFPVCDRWRVRYANGCVFQSWTAYTVTHEGSQPQVAVIIGEIIGHFANDAIMRATARRNRGVFEAESRLW